MLSPTDRTATMRLALLKWFARAAHAQRRVRKLSLRLRRWMRPRSSLGGCRFRQFRPYKLALPGLNSSAVGLVVAACFGMAIKVHAISPFPSSTVVIGILAFCAVHLYKQQAPLVILGSGVLGIIAWAVGSL